VAPTTLLILYAAVIVLASLAGGLLPSLFRFSHRGLQFVLSLVAGIMLGVGFFHMLPHAIMLRAEAAAAAGTTDAHGHIVGHDLLDPLMLWAIGGFLALFLLERFFHFHQHEPESEIAAACAHDHHDHHDHAHEPHGRVARRPGSAIGWSGALIGLGLHSLLEGVALAASVAVGVAEGGGHAALAGLATFLVIVLHKPFDSMTLATLMRHARAPQNIRVLANVLLALLVPAGVGLFWVGAVGGGAGNVAGVASIALAFSAGMFICIASSDLLPELQFHRHDRVGLSLALIVGLGFAFALARMEAASHVHVHTADEVLQHDHGHHDHDHAH